MVDKMKINKNLNIIQNIELHIIEQSKSDPKFEIYYNLKKRIEDELNIILKHLMNEQNINCFNIFNVELIETNNCIITILYNGGFEIQCEDYDSGDLLDLDHILLDIDCIDVPFDGLSVNVFKLIMDTYITTNLKYNIESLISMRLHICELLNEQINEFENTLLNNSNISQLKTNNILKDFEPHVFEVKENISDSFTFCIETCTPYNSFILNYNGQLYNVNKFIQLSSKHIEYLQFFQDKIIYKYRETNDIICISIKTSPQCTSDFYKKFNDIIFTIDVIANPDYIKSKFDDEVYSMLKLNLNGLCVKEIFKNNIKLIMH